MSGRWTPVSLMTGDRYAAWAEKRAKQLRHERNMRWLAAVVIVTLPCIVALVLIGYAWSWL